MEGVEMRNILFNKKLRFNIFLSCNSNNFIWHNLFSLFTNSPIHYSI